jgi:hypothetical protein
MILGSRGHAKLEGSDDEFSTLEGYLDGPDVTGHYDVLEREGDNVVLVDYKTSGSYKVSKALGFHVVEEPTGEVYKSGKRKGQPKTRKILHRDDDFIERRDWELQLNMYRIQLERRGMHVDDMRVMCIVRDGNTWIARSRGVFRNIYYFRIARLDDAQVLSYFERKRQALFRAIEEDKCELVCNAHENWRGIRCTRYCEVAEHCPLGKYLMNEKEADDMPIKGLTDRKPRLSRIGKIGLGVKKTTMKNGKPVEYPSEVDYFVLKPDTPEEEEKQRIIEEFNNLYGGPDGKPRSITVMFPMADPDDNLDVWYRRYGSSTLLQCKGDGEKATCIRDFADGLEVIGEQESMLSVVCAGKKCVYYERKKCTEVATLSVLLPEIEGSGVWHVTTSSIASIEAIRSGFAHLLATVLRVHMVPHVRLERRKREMQHEGRKTIHYPLAINSKHKLVDLQRGAQLDPTTVMFELPEVAVSREDVVYEQTSEDVIHTVEPSVAEGKAYADEMADAVTKSIAKEFGREEALAQVEAEAQQREQKAQQKPEPSGTGNGLTYIDAVVEWASKLDIDAALFGEFCDSIGTQGKTFLRLKAAMEDGKAANKLQRDYDAWYAVKVKDEEPVEMDADPDLL